MSRQSDLESPKSLQLRIEAERAGKPYVTFLDSRHGHVLRDLSPHDELVIGRDPAGDLVIDDEQVSRLHAKLELAGSSWVVVDDGLSRNGTFVNGERVVGQRKLLSGDRILLGTTQLTYWSPSEGTAETASPERGSETPVLTDVQKRVLQALCRPFAAGDSFSRPATNQQIAADVHLSVDSVKAHLRVLFAKFAVGDLAHNEKRTVLAAKAIKSGAVAPHELMTVRKMD